LPDLPGLFFSGPGWEFFPTLTTTLGVSAATKICQPLSPLNLITLNEKKGWTERLEKGLVALSEKLILVAELPMYGPRTMALSRKRWMIGAYASGDLMLRGQFEAFGHKKFFVNEQVLAVIEGGIRQVVVLSAAKSRLLFTHGVPDLSESFVGRIGRALVRSIGEPFFQSSIASEDLYDYVVGTGWRIISEVDEDASHGIERYAVAERATED